MIKTKMLDIGFLFLLFLTIVSWIYSILGYKSGKILATRGKLLLKGKAARRYSLFWIVVSVLLTICLIKYAFS